MKTNASPACRRLPMLSKGPLLLLLLLLTAPLSYGQLQTNREQANQLLQARPSFSIFHDNYIATGSAIGEKPTSGNSDVKYQISMKYRFTNATLPFQTYLFLAYTQKAFWEIYHKSSPFEEINFHPAIGLGKLLLKDGKLVGALALQVEHESNGLDSTLSRSWNFVSLSYSGAISPKSTLALKVWYPYLYQEDNPDLIDYVGYGEARYIWEIKKDKLLLELQGRKGAAWDWKGNLQAQLSYNPFKFPNQYLMLQWYQGYAESLNDYQQQTSMLRIGITVKPGNYIY